MNKVLRVIRLIFSIFLCSPCYPISPCSPCPPNLLHVLPSGMAGWSNFQSPDILYLLLTVDAPKVKHSIILHEQSIPCTMEWNFTPPLSHLALCDQQILGILPESGSKILSNWPGRGVQNMYIFTFDFGNISSQFSRLCMC